MTNFKRVYNQIEKLERTIAHESRTLTNDNSRVCFDHAHTILTDQVAEWIRTAQKADQT